MPSIAVWVGVISLALIMLGHIITVTIYLTKVHMRLLRVEDSCKRLEGVGERLVRIEGDLHHVRNGIQKLEASLGWLTTPAAAKPRAPRKEP